MPLIHIIKKWKCHYIKVLTVEGSIAKKLTKTSIGIHTDFIVQRVVMVGLYFPY